MTIRERITSKAIEILERETTGLKYSELCRRIKTALPNENENTISRTVVSLDKRVPSKIYKPAKGVFQHVKSKNEITGITATPTTTSIREEDFYASFAQWIKDELQECTKAIPLGRNYFKDKWGTPDVIGIWESNRTDIIKARTEVISAEIKTDTGGIIVAFGQACAYKLFSHRVYIVLPEQIDKGDLSRIDSLCMIFGIGLIIFDAKNVKEPNYRIQVRASRHEPDMFYVNENMKRREVKDLF